MGIYTKLFKCINPSPLPLVFMIIYFEIMYTCLKSLSMTLNNHHGLGTKYLKTTHLQWGSRHDKCNHSLFIYKKGKTYDLPPSLHRRHLTHHHLTGLTSWIYGSVIKRVCNERHWTPKLLSWNFDVPLQRFTFFVTKKIHHKIFGKIRNDLLSPIFNIGWK